MSAVPALELEHQVVMSGASVRERRGRKRVAAAFPHQSDRRLLDGMLWGSATAATASFPSWGAWTDRQLTDSGWNPGFKNGCSLCGTFRGAVTPRLLIFVTVYQAVS